MDCKLLKMVYLLVNDFVVEVLIVLVDDQKHVESNDLSQFFEYCMFLFLFLTYQTVAAQLSTGSVSTAGTPPDAPWLLTSNGAGTAATTPKHLSLPNAGGLAYPANGGAALHDTSFTYAKPPTSPPLPNDVAYTAPNIGAPIVPYPSLLQMSSTTMPHRHILLDNQDKIKEERYHPLN